MSGKQEPPDFAMMRAVEILANLYDRMYTRTNVPPPPLDKPVILFNETCAFQIGKTTQAMVVAILGWGFSYPTRGWHTYAVAGEDGSRQLLSAFYKDHALIAVELYVPKTDRTPDLEPRRLGAFRFVPGEIRLGIPVTSIPQTFVPAVGGPGPVVYDASFEARFEGGVAYAMGTKGFVERLALYAQTGERRT
ncbi:MAG: hypothetical protein GIW97_00135 [Candidatus Eremiobacteraeota bacterium]|nr:hypothetical protein [Candidatus Eremiobacteraeota bacterium]